MVMHKTPVQVYLDPRDRTLLRRLAQRLGLSQAEAIREAVRRWAREMAGDDDRLMALVGSIDDPELPADLSTRHDEYAVGGYAEPKGPTERGGGRSL